MKTVFDAQYSTTNGEMWVAVGTHATERDARRELTGYAKAGNPTRVIERDEDAVGTVSQLVRDGKAIVI
jgi:hypothetical protein